MFFPKEMDFDIITEKEIAYAIGLIITQWKIHL